MYDDDWDDILEAFAEAEYKEAEKKEALKRKSINSHSVTYHEIPTKFHSQMLENLIAALPFSYPCTEHVNYPGCPEYRPNECYKNCRKKPIDIEKVRSLLEGKLLKKCPYCLDGAVKENSSPKGEQRYKCVKCKRTITFISRLEKELKKARAMRMFYDHFLCYDIAKKCEVKQSTISNWALEWLKTVDCTIDKVVK